MNLETQTRTNLDQGFREKKSEFSDLEKIQVYQDLLFVFLYIGT